MKINTKFLGSVEIQEDEIIFFEQGIPGFPNQQKYVLLSLGKDLPFLVLQSITESSLGFIVADPFIINSTYSFELTDTEKNELNIFKPEDVLTYVIVSVKEPFEESTMNLLAPIVININSRKAKQIVLQDNEKYPLHYPIQHTKGSAV